MPLVAVRREERQECRGKPRETHTHTHTHTHTQTTYCRSKPREGTIIDLIVINIRIAPTFITYGEGKITYYILVEHLENIIILL
jgi:hypothetical protein